MAHEKVFGVCENKCRVEVEPKAKTEIKTPLYYHSATITVTESNKNTIIEKRYQLPEGLNVDDVVPIALVKIHKFVEDDITEDSKTITNRELCTLDSDTFRVFTEDYDGYVDNYIKVYLSMPDKGTVEVILVYALRSEMTYGFDYFE